jgi:multidrug efflux system membrane fusion protein
MKLPTLGITVATLGLLALSSWGCGPKGKSGQAGAPPPPVVTVAAPEQQEIVEWNEFTGRTAPVEFVEVRPRISGHIQEIRFQSGQMVRQGDVLFVIDPRWQRAELDQREAELVVARVRQENAEREAKRTGQLLAGRAISQEEADTREARFQEAKSQVYAVEAACKYARLELENTEVRSPIHGRVSRALVTVGNYVNGNAAGATVLTTLVSVDPVHVYADMDENALLRFNTLSRSGKLSRGDEGKIPVELGLADETGYPHKGFVESLDNRVDPQSGSILLRTVFPNPDGRLLPGLFARVRVPGSEKHPVLLIHETAIGTDQAQKFVMTLTSSNTAAYRPVTLGPSLGGKRVVRAGLQAGDRIIVNGLSRVRPGMVVTAQEAGTDGATPAAGAAAQQQH